MKRHGFLLRLLLWLAALMLILPGCLAEGLSAEAAGDMIDICLDRCVEGNEYILFMLREGANAASFSNDDICFMDQMTASGSTIEAVFVNPGYTRVEVLAGGVFSDGSASPRKLTYTLSRLPAELQVIEEGAFENVSFTHIFLGEVVQDIESRAFANNPSLVYIYIPRSVTSIAPDAFSGSPNVVIGCEAGSEAEAFGRRNHLKTRLL